MKSADVSNKEQAQRILDMVGDAVFKNLAMRVLDTIRCPKCLFREASLRNALRTQHARDPKSD